MDDLIIPRILLAVFKEMIFSVTFFLNIDGHHVIMLKTILQFSCIVIFQKVLEGFS